MLLDETVAELKGLRLGVASHILGYCLVGSDAQILAMLLSALLSLQDEATFLSDAPSAPLSPVR